MSLITMAHTFTAYVEKELAKVLKEAPTIIQIADHAIPYASGLIDIALSMEGGAALIPEVQQVSAEAQRDLLVVSGLIFDAGAQPTIATRLSAVIKNLQSLLDAGHIKNASSVGYINKAVAALMALVGALVPAEKPAA